MCSTDGGASFGACNIVMNTGFITGTVPIKRPFSGQTTLVQILAEDTGTNNIVSALPAEIKVTNSNAASCAADDCVLSFTINVPTPVFPATTRSFDLIATTVDTYQGFGDPYPGHTIAVLANVAGPTNACDTAPVAATFAPDQEIDCTGHGSISGFVGNANLGTSAFLSKKDMQAGLDVRLTSSIVLNQAPLPNSTNLYSFCAPADTYDVRRFQLPIPDPNVAPDVMPIPLPDGDPISVTIPPPPPFHGPAPTPTGGATPTATMTGGATPTATPTPSGKCPTTCTNPDGSCPGICNNVNQTLNSPQ
jgi:hypothetical protein